MIQNDTNDTRGEGNTKPPLRSLRNRKWAFTVNNPGLHCFDTLTQHLLGVGAQYIIGKEIGEAGTPHLQGFALFKNARTLASMKKMAPRAHFEIAKGSLKQNYDYCSKDGDFKTNIDFETFQSKLKKLVLDMEYKEVTWKKWQQNILNILEKKPDNRKIYWVWDNEGNKGKSFLCKYLCTTMNVILCDGKKDNIFNQIKVEIDEKRVPKVMLVDIPRDNLEWINYGTLEKVKDGCVYSGKYEGGMCIYPIPHLIIFANAEPQYHKMSEDRWIIINLDDVEDSFVSPKG